MSVHGFQRRGRAFPPRRFRCLIRAPSSTTTTGDATLLVGHGGSAGTGGGKDEHAFLVGVGGGGAPSSSSSQLLWKSMAVSPDGRHLAAGCADGTCMLWDWRNADGDNLVRSWKAHHRPVSCVTFDLGDSDGATLFTAGEDGVVNAWSLVDLVDRDGVGDYGVSSSSVVRPFRTWSEHHLPVTSLCVLPGSGRGSVRLVSSSLDRNLVVMELGGGAHGGGVAGGGGDGNGNGIGRTLARMCLPSGVRVVASDASGGRLYCGGADGCVYCVDLCEFAVRESVAAASLSSSSSEGGGGGGGSLARRDEGRRRGRAPSHVSELRGHAKAVTCLTLLDPSDLASRLSSNDDDDDDGGGGTSTLLASGSEDGTLRVWDLRARSCVKVIRPWSASSSAIVAVARFRRATGAARAPSSAASSRAHHLGRRRNADEGSECAYKPLRGFVRGTSVICDEDDIDDAGSSLSGGCAPILWPRRDESFVRYWEDPIPTKRTIASSRKRTRKPSSRGERDEIDRLRKELAESQTVIERWQAVNNQLVSKLKATGN
ncbi:hypothetical protein ACHAW5_006769 [Stephanodiscus triporus]|uniref:Uncharacterized protein n=1 Tax=Stephanodiscus triporus TaxID=2934178 RepID=A0ABD3NQ22_9STRA